jgi:hypothetical protein
LKGSFDRKYQRIPPGVVTAQAGFDFTTGFAGDVTYAIDDGAKLQSTLLREEAFNTKPKPNKIGISGNRILIGETQEYFWEEGCRYRVL